MAILSFPNQVLDPDNFNPDMTATNNYSLSAAGVALHIVGSNVESVAFNNAPVALTGQLATLSANTVASGVVGADSVRLRVDSAYNGVQFAIIYKNRTSSLFTAATATVAPALQTLTNNGAESVSPNIRRLSLLGYL